MRPISAMTASQPFAQSQELVLYLDARRPTLRRAHLKALSSNNHKESAEIEMSAVWDPTHKAMGGCISGDSVTWRGMLGRLILCRRIVSATIGVAKPNSPS